MNGLDMLKAYSEQNIMNNQSNPLIIGMSSKYSLDEVMACFAYGMIGHLVHPIASRTVEKIVKIIRNAKDRKDAIQRLVDSKIMHICPASDVSEQASPKDSCFTSNSSMDQSAATTIDSQLSSPGYVQSEGLALLRGKSQSKSFMSLFNSFQRQTTILPEESVSDSTRTSISQEIIPIHTGMRRRSSKVLPMDSSQESEH
jgi:hypothetical protein